MEDKKSFVLGILFYCYHCLLLPMMQLLLSVLRLIDYLAILHMINQITKSWSMDKCNLVYTIV